MLLERDDISSNTLQIWLNTALHAAWNNHEGIVRILLERNDVNPYTTDQDDWTPPSFVAQDMKDRKDTAGAERQFPQT